jgi:nucleoid DNA-binding protein
MSDKPKAVTKINFVRKFMRDCGMSYRDACRAYESMVSVFENAVITGERVNIGEVGAIQPVWVPPRTAHMGFKRTKGNQIERISQHYFLDGRYKYRFRLFPEFIRRHTLKWFR